MAEAKYLFENIFKIKNLHIKRELDLGLKVAVVHLKEPMYEFSEVDVFILAQIEHCKKSFSNDTWEVGVCQQSDFVDTFALVVGLGDQVLENVLEVRDSDILLELLVVQDLVIDKFDFVARLGLILHF